MKSTRLRTRHELESVALHFFYEVTQMREALVFWKSGPPALHRLALEDFLLHARNLLNMFYEARVLHEVSDDDVLARDFYVPPASWERIRPGLPPTLEGVRERLNKLLAHLTYSRIGYAQSDAEDWRWPCAEMGSELEELVALFLRNLPAENKDFFSMLDARL
jgi:hypothetical protein